MHASPTRRPRATKIVDGAATTPDDDHDHEGVVYLVGIVLGPLALGWGTGTPVYVPTEPMRLAQ